MPVTPTGMLSLPLANLRTALSNCAAFRTWVGAADATAALAYISLVEKGGSLTGKFAVIDDGTEYMGERTSSGATFHEEGSLALIFQGNVHADNANSEVDAQFEFTNSVGAILEELIEYCGNNSNVFNISKFSKIFGPWRADDEERNAGNDYIQMGFWIGWY
jgi:hypothetical protein